MLRRPKKAGALLRLPFSCGAAEKNFPFAVGYSIVKPAMILEVA
jgi:hypothetical protein